MGTVLMGYAIEKHGVANRFALGFLALPGIGGRTRRLTFAYMVVTGLISMFVSDTATIAMMIPIGMSLVRHIRTLAGSARDAKTNFGAFMTLAHVLRGARRRHRDDGRHAAQRDRGVAARGVHRPVARLVRLDGGRRAGLRRARWSCFYVMLWLLVPPEMTEVPERRGLPPRRAREARCR